MSSDDRDSSSGEDDDEEMNVEDIRQASSSAFRHGRNGDGGGQNVQDKYLVIRIGQSQGLLGVFLFFWGLMLLGEVGVNMHDEMVMERTCAGPVFVALLFLDCAWTVFFVGYISYKRMEWNAKGWDEPDNLSLFAFLAVCDLGMSLWLFGGCACAANQAIFFVLAFVTVMAKVCLSCVHLFHFNLIYHLYYGAYICEGMFRSAMRQRGIDKSQYSRTPTKAEGDYSDEGSDRKGDVEEGMEWQVASSKRNFGKNSLARKLSFARSREMTPQSGRRVEMASVAPSPKPSVRNAADIDPAEFTRLWESMPQSGAFENPIADIPQITTLLTHLEDRGFSPIAHGMVRNCTKVYFFKSETFGLNPVRFLCEFKIWHSSKLLSATFKCESRKHAKDFVKCLDLGKVFQ
eukprot:g39.t1